MSRSSLGLVSLDRQRLVVFHGKLFWFCERLDSALRKRRRSGAKAEESFLRHRQSLVGRGAAPCEVEHRLDPPPPVRQEQTPTSTSVGVGAHLVPRLPQEKQRGTLWGFQNQRRRQVVT